MSPVILAVIGAAVILLAAKSVFAPSIDAAAARATATKDLTPLIDLLAGRKPSAQPDAFNRAIKRLWDDYERELAAVVIKELAQRLPDEAIAQYWLDQVQKVEPELAAKMLEPQFLERYYRAEVASRCGSFG